MQRLELEQRITSVDLAQALKDQQGTFLAQAGGQSFLVVAQHGHSIKSMRPVGRRFSESLPPTSGAEAWTVELLSYQDIDGGQAENQTYEQGRPERQQQTR